MSTGSPTLQVATPTSSWTLLGRCVSCLKPAKPLLTVKELIATVPELREVGCRISNIARRGVAIEQLDFLLNTAEKVRGLLESCENNADCEFSQMLKTLSDLTAEIVQPLKERHHCSFVEMVAKKEQPALFFVCYVGCTVLQDLVTTLKFHAEHRALPEAAVYWIHALAMSPADPTEESEISPLLRVVREPICRGMLGVLNAKVHPRTIFDHPWCLLEMAAAQEEPQRRCGDFFLDFGAVLPKGTVSFGAAAGDCQLLQVDSGNGQFDWVRSDPLALLPPKVLRACFTMPSVNPRAEKEPEMEPARETLKESKCLPKLSAYLQERFAGAAINIFAGQPRDIVTLKQILKDHPGFANSSNGLGETPLFRAAHGGDEATELLLQAQADPRKERGDGAVPLQMAALQPSLKAFRLLLDARADPAVRRSDKASISFLAAQAGNRDALELLVELKQEMLTSRSDGTTPLLMACTQLFTQPQEDLSYLDCLAVGLDVPNQEQVAPIHVAAISEPADLLRWALAARADVNLLLKDGASPLLLAAQECLVENVKLLLEARANVNAARWGDGATAYSVVAGKVDPTSRHDWFEILGCLKAHGAKHSDSLGPHIAYPDSVVPLPAPTIIAKLLPEDPLDTHHAEQEAASKLQLEYPAGWKQLVSTLAEDFPFQGYVEKTELRAMTFADLQRCLDYALRRCSLWFKTTTKVAVTEDTVNLHDFRDWCIHPATCQKHCAFVELLTNVARVPNWYVSHCWQEPMKRFLAGIKEHMEVCQLPQDTCYWVCAYANRQWALSQDITVDPGDSSFFKAMSAATGVLLIVDKDGTPFQRMWCAYEAYVGLKDLKKTYDIVTTKDSRTYLLTDGLTAAETSISFVGEAGGQLKVLREMCFPGEVLEKGLWTNIEDALCWSDEDLRHILNKIAGRKNAKLRAEVLRNHEQYKAVNHRIGSRLALSMWVKIAGAGQTETLRLPEVLKADEDLPEVILDFSNLADVDTDAIIGNVGLGLPEKLTKLDVKFNKDFNPGPEGPGQALKKMLQQCFCVTHATLNFFGLRMVITEVDVAAFAEGLTSMRSLQHLDVHFHSNGNMSDHALALLGKGLAKLQHLQYFSINLSSCKQLEGCGVAAMVAALVKLPHFQHLALWLSNLYLSEEGWLALLGAIAMLPGLRKLDFQVHGSASFDDTGVLALSAALANHPNLLELNLQLGCAGVQDGAVVALVAGLSHMRAMQKLELQFDKCEHITSDTVSACAATVAELQELTELSLSFHRCEKVADHAVVPLASAIGHLKHLHKLDLDFQGCDLHDPAILTLAAALSTFASSPELANFKELFLVVKGNPEVSDGAVATLAAALARLTVKNLWVLLPVNSRKDEAGRGDQVEITTLAGLTALQAELPKDLLPMPPLAAPEQGKCSLARDNDSHLFNPLEHMQVAQQALQDLSGDLEAVLSSRARDHRTGPAPAATTNQPLKFRANFQDTCGPWEEILCRSLSRCHALNCLDLGLRGIPEGFFGLLSNLEHLWELKLNFAGIEMEDEHLAALAVVLPKMKSLRNLVFECYWSKKITNQGLVAFGDKLKLLEKLESLSLLLNDCSALGTEGVATLGQTLGQLSHLRSLSLSFSKLIKEDLPEDVEPGPLLEIDDEAVKSLMAHLPELVDLSLSFTTYDCISQVGAHALQDALGRWKSSLQHLNLRLAPSIPDEAIAALAAALTPCTDMRSLQLDLEGCTEMTTKSYKSLAKALVGLRELRSLTLNMPGCACTSGASAKALAAALAQLQKLENLRLNLEQSDLRDRDVYGLSHSIAGLAQLQELDLGLRECSRLTEASITSLKEALPHLKSLQSVLLSLKFHTKKRYCHVTLDAVLALVEELTKCPELYHLRVQVPYYAAGYVQDAKFTTLSSLQNFLRRSRLE